MDINKINIISGLIRQLVFAKKLVNKYINKKARKNKVHIFHIGRCGSTVLSKILNQHSKVLSVGEIFEKYKDNKCNQKFIRKTISHRENSKISRVFFFETKYLKFQHLNDECLNFKLKQYIEFLLQNGYDKQIIIHRSNYLRWLCSAKIGEKENLWHTTKKNEISKITIEVNNIVDKLSLLELFEYLDKRHSELLNELDNHDYLLLNYEKDIKDDPVKAYLKVCDFCNISPQKPEVHLKKTNPWALSDMIINYEQVENSLSGTPYEWMLYD